MKWTKNSDINLMGIFSKETWIRTEGKTANKYPMEIYLGKKTDLVKLKKISTESIKTQLPFYSKTRKKLYKGNKSKMVYVSKCPVTGIKTEKCDPIFNVYGAEYVQTPDTGHVYLKYIPSKEALHDFYSRNANYASTYADKANAENRLKSVSYPLVEWVKEVYKRQYKRYPKKILDIGAGAGHFVEACRRMNIRADGIELSESSRKFAKETWGVELDKRSLEESYKDYIGYDVVTFWGLLEHIPNPQELLKIANKVVKKSPNGGMAIAKLPRWLSLSSASQRLNPETVTRHIDPLGHLMLFTDASAAELFFRCKFKPVSAWYYGMDVYETLMQFGNRIGDYSLLLDTVKIQTELQQFVDENRFSDGLILVGI